MHEHVFTPLTVNGLEIPNRVLRTAHGTNIGHGALTDDLIEYHAARARGGVGLTILEATSVHPSGPMALHAWDDSIIPRYAELMRVVRPTGMRVFSQLNHMGRYLTAPWERAWSPSEVVTNAATGMRSHAMTEGDIAELVGAYARAARRALEGGLDGVEVHAAHDFLVQQFLSPASNHRDDQYGGSIENRMRLLVDILRAVRAATSAEFPVGVRVGPQNAPGGLNVEEHLAIVGRLTAEGLVDFVDISHGVTGGGTNTSIGAMHEPTGYELPMSVPVARAARSAGVAAFVTGRFRTLDDVETVLARGDADMVGMTRAHIADPDLVAKTRAGRAETVRPCIGCNQGCLGGLVTGRMTCTVNPAAGRERSLGDDILVRAATPLRVTVVGGGPAGLEAARVAAIRGHDVTIVEASEALGGTVQLARLAPRHEGIGDIVDWLGAEVARLGVEVRAGVAVDGWSVDADRVVLATGAHDEAHGLTIERLLRGQHGPLGGTAVVVDEVGDYAAIGAAEYLAAAGVRVTFVTGFTSFAPGMEAAGVSRPALDRLRSTEGFMLVTRARVLGLAEGGISVESLDGLPAFELMADTVVVSQPRRPRDELSSALDARGIPFIAVGDAAGAGSLLEAIRTGNLAGRSI